MISWLFSLYVFLFTLLWGCEFGIWWIFLTKFVLLLQNKFSFGHFLTFLHFFVVNAFKLHIGFRWFMRGLQWNFRSYCHRFIVRQGCWADVVQHNFWVSRIHRIIINFRVVSVSRILIRFIVEFYSWKLTDILSRLELRRILLFHSRRQSGLSRIKPQRLNLWRVCMDCIFNACFLLFLGFDIKNSWFILMLCFWIWFHYIKFRLVYWLSATQFVLWNLISQKLPCLSCWNNFWRGHFTYYIKFFCSLQRPLPFFLHFPLLLILLKELVSN